jgi:hypothetical protein
MRPLCGLYALVVSLLQWHERGEALARKEILAR